MSNQIAEFQTADVIAATPGQLIDRSRVIDQLLDLRLEAGTDAALTRLLDEILADVPGKSVVELVWWRDTLDRVARAADCQPAV